MLAASSSHSKIVQNFSAMRLNLVLLLPELFTFSMLVERSFSIEGGPQKKTPISAGRNENAGQFKLKL
jgi:hypothetical protein